MIPPPAADGFAKRASPFLRKKIAAGGAALAAIGKNCVLWPFSPQGIGMDLRIHPLRRERVFSI